MARRFVCGEFDAAKLNQLTIVERAVHVSRRKARQPRKISGPTGLGSTNVAVHNHQFRAGLLQDGGRAREMVEVSLTVQENLRVSPMETERLDALADERRRRFQVRIDEYVAGRRRDEITSQIAAADIKQIARNAKRLLRRRPCRVCLRAG